MPSAADVIKIATSQVGVHEGKSGGSWNNIQRYSEETPGFSWSDGQPWCDTFVAWCAWKAGFTEGDWPRSASCDTSGAAFKKANRWSEYPAIGGQIFFGTSSDLQHTGIVTGYDDTHVHTVEGNTNSTGSYQGDGVYAKIHERRDPRVVGYGYPKFPEGITSADPAWQGTQPTPTPKPPKSGSLRIDGVDISHYQAGVLDYTAARKAGVRFIYHKASEGTSYADPAYAKRRAEVSGLIARARRRPRFGAYHFARPAPGNAATEARYFLSTAAVKRGDLAPVLDLEQTGGLSIAKLDDWAVAWGQTVKADHPKAGIYTPFDLPKAAAFFDFAWRPRYNSTDTPPPLAWDIFQFSNGVDGVPNAVAGMGHVDLNHLRDGLTVHDLRLPRRHKKPAPKPKATLILAITPGRFDRTAKSLRALMDVLTPASDLIVGTEVATEPRGKALDSKDWAHFRGPNTPGADECFIAWPTAYTEVIAADSVQVTDLTYFQTDGHPMAPVHVAIAALRHIPTQRVRIVTVGHYPSDVQGHGGPEGFWNTAVQRRVDAHRSATAGTGRLVAAWAAKYGADEQLVTGDWNLDIKDAKVRAWFAVQFPGYLPTFPADYKGKGDLGRRAVAFALTKGVVVTDGPHEHDTVASDHRYSLTGLASA